MEADLALLEQGRSVRRKRTRERRWSITRTAALIFVLLVVVGLGLQQLIRSFVNRGTAGAANADSIFVLPFRHSAPGPFQREAWELEQDVCLCGRLTDAFIDGLALIPGVTTGPRKSGWFRQNEDDVRHGLARTNDSRYILTGRVDHTNDVLRFTLRLYERQKDEPFWTETFAGTTNDVITLEQQAFGQIARRFDWTIPEPVQQQIDRTLSNNLAAYYLFLRARATYISGFKTDWRDALALYNEAAILDPRCVAAKFGVLYVENELGNEDPPSTYQLRLYERALGLIELDNTFFQGYLRAANKRLYYDYDWDSAMREYDRMIATWPDEDLDWAVYYRTLGRTNEARIYHERMKRKPHPNLMEAGFIVYGELVWHHYDEAIRATQRVNELYPEGMVGPMLLGVANLAAGHYREAIDYLKKAGGPAPHPYMLGYLGRAYALSGDRTNALEMLRKLEIRVSAGETDPYFLAWIQVALGQTNEALASLHQAVDYRSSYLVHSDFGGLRTDPAWDGLRDDPRFDAICRRVGMGKGQWPK